MITTSHDGREDVADAVRTGGRTFSGRELHDACPREYLGRECPEYDEGALQAHQTLGIHERALPPTRLVRVNVRVRGDCVVRFSTKKRLAADRELGGQSSGRGDQRWR